MTALLLWGCMLLAYGPPAVFFLLYVGRRSALLLACLVAALFLWAALLCTSLLWWMVPPLRGQASYPLIVGVLFTEIFRYALLLLYVRADRAMERLGRPQRPRLLNDLAGGLSLGLGFGLMASIMGSGALLSLAGSTAAWYRLPECPALNAHALAAGSALLQCALHVATMPLALDALRRWTVARAAGAPGYVAASRVLAPGALHLALSLAGLIASAGSLTNACTAVLPLQLLLVCAGAGAARAAAMRPDFVGTRQVKAWEAVARRLRDEGRQ